ncbi:hypothetical protein HPP92_028795 [Vanilla planifolia]|uniref:Uncharacterized protein n=1 Tax=Vanilla planifolia TaxID=51239 RepID=A0A835P624_VANPL|nr:hypothetical protein HPP92_028795 [Vanilla planifolia]KAG0446526.1 hypothetical protein HPP92_028784 [Vanilla planifolia]
MQRYDHSSPGRHHYSPLAPPVAVRSGKFSLGQATQGWEMRVLQREGSVSHMVERKMFTPKRLSRLHHTPKNTAEFQEPVRQKTTENFFRLRVNNPQKTLMDGGCPAGSVLRLKSCRAFPSIDFLLSVTDEDLFPCFGVETFMVCESIRIKTRREEEEEGDRVTGDR